MKLTEFPQADATPCNFVFRITKRKTTKFKNGATLTTAMIQQLPSKP